MSEVFLLVDAHHQVYRAFFAVAPFTGPGGEPVNAVHGFTRMLRKWLNAYRPTHGAAVFDLGPSAGRLATWPGYKANRPPKPPEMTSQLPTIRRILDAMRFPLVELEGEEADDVIASLAENAARRGAKVYVASNDKDFAELVGERVFWVRSDRKDDVVMDTAAVTARFGVAPAQMTDYLSLIGDSVDNIPGVPGIGEKTAAELLRQFGSVENLISHVDEINRPKLRDSVRAHTGQIRMNRTLISLSKNLKLPLTLDEMKIGSPDYSKLSELFRQCGLKSLLADLEKDSQQTDDLFAQR